jgi:hypothetical protein
MADAVCRQKVNQIEYVMIADMDGDTSTNNVDTDIVVRLIDTLETIFWLKLC